MGGSVIGLFGDFGDGWVSVSLQSGETLEFGGVHLYERNPYIFGLKDGNQGWNQAEVGKTYYDYHFQGITNLEDFSSDPGSGNRNLLINGFGLQVHSKKGGVVSGKEGEAITVQDLRDGSLGFATAKNGVREIQVTVKRVGIVSSKEGQVDQVISLDDMCVVNVGRKDSVYMIFAGVKMSKHEEKWVPQDAERLLKLDGCRFFGSIPQDRKAWLHRVHVGSGAKSSMFIVAEGGQKDAGSIIRWSSSAKGVFQEPLKNGEFGSVALVGVVADMTKFLPAADCKKGHKKAGSFCTAATEQLKSYDAERLDKEGYKKKETKFGTWVAPNGDDEDETASTGNGWLTIRSAEKKGNLEGWNNDGFRKWVRDQLKKDGWMLPEKSWVGMAWNFQLNTHTKDGKRFTPEFRKQISADGDNAGSKYEWKKTAVMRHEKIKALEKLA